MSTTWKNTTHAWGAISKTLHWLLAVMILGQLVLGKVADEAAVSPHKLDLFVWHKSIGVSILFLVVLRVAWRLANPPPCPAPNIPRWETNVARAGHMLLYVLILVVPLSGWFASDTSRIPFRAFWVVPMPDFLPVDQDLHAIAEDIHGVLTKVLLAVVIVHIAAALRHHFFQRNDTLRRMLPRWRSTK